jgi:hypothetical protein
VKSNQDPYLINERTTPQPLSVQTSDTGDTPSDQLHFAALQSRIKTNLVISFDSQGVVHKEFVPQGKTVNAEFYKGVMDRLLKRIQRVRQAAF